MQQNASRSATAATTEATSTGAVDLCGMQFLNFSHLVRKLASLFKRHHPQVFRNRGFVPLLLTFLALSPSSDDEKSVICNDGTI